MRGTGTAAGRKITVSLYDRAILLRLSLPPSIFDRLTAVFSRVLIRHFWIFTFSSLLWVKSDV